MIHQTQQSDTSNSPTDKSLRFVFWNINGTGNKNSKLYHEDVQNLLFHKHDIIIITETHAKKTLHLRIYPYSPTLIFTECLYIRSPLGPLVGLVFLFEMLLLMVLPCTQLMNALY